MRRFQVQAAPAELLSADAARFDDWVIGTVIQHSNQQFDYEVVRRYCHWFVGSERGWKWTFGDKWFAGARRDWMPHLGVHLAGGYAEPCVRVSVHSTCKTGRYRNRPFHWTRYVAFDIDQKHDAPLSVAERYRLVVRALDAEPLVLRSPSHGLHVYVALTVPMSLFGLVRTANPRYPALLPALVEQHGIDVRPGYVELFPSPKQTLRLPLAPGMIQLDPATLAPLPPLSRSDEVARVVNAMDQQIV